MMKITNSSSTWERIGVFIGHSFRYRIDFFMFELLQNPTMGGCRQYFNFRDKIHCPWTPWIFDKKTNKHGMHCTNPNWVKMYLLSICELHKNQNRCVIFPVHFFLSAYRVSGRCNPAISHRLHRRFNCALCAARTFPIFSQMQSLFKCAVCAGCKAPHPHFLSHHSMHNGSTI